MPRPKKAGGPEPKKRSRNGCWPCKGRKVKCDELHPACMNCQRQGETCDYSIRLNWDGRGKKKDGESSKAPGQITFSSTPMPTSVFSAQRPQPEVGVLQMNQQQGLVQPPLDNYGGTSYLEDSGYVNYSARKQPSPLIDPLLRASERSEQDPDLPQEQDIIPGYERYRGVPTDNLSIAQRPLQQRVRYDPYSSGLPSPSTPDASSPAIPSFANTSVFIQNAPTSNPPTYLDRYENDNSNLEASITDRPVKRPRYDSIAQESRSPRSYGMPPPNSLLGGGSSGTQSFAHSPWLSTGSPLTPTASSTYSDDASKPGSKLSPYASYDAAENARRKPSIESLLSGPAGMGSDYSSTPGRGSVSTTRGSFSDNRGSISTYSDARPSISDTNVPEGAASNSEGNNDSYVTYGVDRGFKDLDVPRNDDANAISGGSPTAARAHIDFVSDAEASREFGFGVQAKHSEFGDEYYARPVPITLPKSFEPLPACLQNRMNLLYFHHFISHTARILVPHHCSFNPFQKLLPKMALQDQNIMSLLLAYSASHRARLLRQPVPKQRIALWVEEIIPNLIHALNDPSRMSDNSTFATAVMLASLEIICPMAFGSDIGWRQHLNIARQLIAARGGAKSMHQEHSEVTHFLLRWFAYLDIMGNLTGAEAVTENGASWASEYDVDDSEHDSFQIDCLLGFTSRCISILAQISDLARLCDRERIDSHHNIRADYVPFETALERAQRLLADVKDSLAHTAIRVCSHPQASGESASQWDDVEMKSVNAAYHWAGLVHLHRRVLGKSSEHPDVQEAVREILSALSKVREGSTAEACLLFPMFTAGCDAQDSKQKSDIMKRIRIVEDCGLSQVHKARSLMERVWETGRPWETLVAGEFVG